MKIIVGPCAIENKEHALDCGRFLKRLQTKLQWEININIELIYKSCFNKANRSSKSSFHGVGLEEGLEILKEVKEETGLRVTSDFHSKEEARAMSGIIDIYQVPHSLCRYSEILEAAAMYADEISVKKGTFMDASEVGNIVTKLREFGHGGEIILIHRGTCFGRKDLVMDMLDYRKMKESIGSDNVTLCCDATHAAQNRRKAPILALCSLIAGADMVFIEAHPDPDCAPCDGPSMVSFDKLEDLIVDICRTKQFAEGLTWRY